MKVVFGLALTVLYVLQISAIPVSFIQDGSVAVNYKHAVIVLALQRVGAHRALLGGGNIITDKHILTTAHLCVGAKEFRIGYGNSNARETSRPRARSALIHQHFNPDTLENDLAVILLSNGDTFSSRNAKPIAISCRGLFPGDDGQVASFGFTSDNANSISDQLMVARQVVIDNAPCARVFNRQLHRNQFCGQDQPPPAIPNPAIDDDDDDDEEDDDDDDDDDDRRRRRRRSARNTARPLTSVCRGDTGSGLFRKVGEDDILFALVSRVPSGCNRENPAIYTNVAPFCSWLIDATLGAVNTVN